LLKIVEKLGIESDKWQFMASGLMRAQIGIVDVSAAFMFFAHKDTGINAFKNNRLFCMTFPWNFKITTRRTGALKFN
jgi:hypothetical protein